MKFYPLLFSDPPLLCSTPRSDCLISRGLQESIVFSIEHLHESVCVYRVTSMVKKIPTFNIAHLKDALFYQNYCLEEHELITLFYLLEHKYSLVERILKELKSSYLLLSLYGQSSSFECKFASNSYYGVADTWNFVNTMLLENDARPLCFISELLQSIEKKDVFYIKVSDAFSTLCKMLYAFGEFFKDLIYFCNPDYILYREIENSCLCVVFIRREDQLQLLKMFENKSVIVLSSIELNNIGHYKFCEDVRVYGKKFSPNVVKRMLQQI